mmetsp:Transcript_103748/g.302825  ORF Transcript_103748/g.302825 Transcript_103748/m.302825 type:complete len:744 (+) Transcript_103748:81-2312(+)
MSRRSAIAQPIPTKVALQRGPCLKALAGLKPLYTPSSVPLDLLFFRRVFSNLHRMHGDVNGEVPITVFQRTMVRLYRTLGMQDQEFDAEEYDKDNSRAVGWYEFVSCWRKSKVCLALSMPERVFLAMEDPSTCFLGEVANVIVTVLIFISCVSFICGTLPSLRDTPCDDCEPTQLEIFDVLEGVCIGVFTLEYVVRLVTAPFSRTELLDYEKVLSEITGEEPMSIPSPLIRLLTFLVQPMNLIDIFVIAPFYVELLAGMVASNFTVLRVLRLTRLFRLIKLGKYFEVLEIIVRVFRRSTKMLYVLGVYLILGLCFSSAAMYYVECGSWDPDQRQYVRVSHEGERSVTPFASIPHAFWWCVVTFTTVGYGEVVPVTFLGKIVASCTMIVGILVLAMPISVISMNFNEVWADWNEEKRMEAETRHQDLQSVSEALQGMENCRHLLVELWDDRLGREDPEFLGEVEWRDLPVDSRKVERQDYFLPLQSNYSKKPTDKAAGVLSGSIAWQPAMMTASEDPGEKEPRIQGTLEVRVGQAAGLLRSDWKKGCMRDVYALVHCWPRPPDGRGGNTSDRYRTRTVHGSLDPKWEELVTFEFDWPVDWRPPPDRQKSRTPTRMASPSRTALNLARTGATLAAESPSAQGRAFLTPQGTRLLGGEDNSLRETVEEQGRDIKALSSQVAEIRALLCEIREGLWEDKAEATPRLTTPDRLKIAAGPQAPPPAPHILHFGVPGTVEAEFDGPPLRF